MCNAVIKNIQTNPAIEAHATELLTRMALPEKVGQLVQSVPVAFPSPIHAGQLSAQIEGASVNKRKLPLLRQITFMTVMVISSACTPSIPFNCSTLNEAVVTTFPTTEKDPAAIGKWIERNYPAAVTSLQSGLNVVGQTWFYWFLDQSEYHATVSSDGSGLLVDWKGPKPSLREVIGCFEVPDSYEVRLFPPRDEATLNQFGIWYPAKSMEITSIQSGSRLTVNENTIFSRISVPSPYSISLMKLRPWPSKMSDLQLDH